MNLHLLLFSPNILPSSDLPPQTLLVKSTGTATGTRLLLLNPGYLRMVDLHHLQEMHQPPQNRHLHPHELQHLPHQILETFWELPKVHLINLLVTTSTNLQFTAPFRVPSTITIMIRVQPTQQTMGPPQTTDTTAPENGDT